MRHMTAPALTLLATTLEVWENMIPELEIGMLKDDLPKYGLRAGDTGTVVLVHAGGKAYEVEFFTPWGKTIDVYEIPGDCIEPWAPASDALAPTLEYCKLAVAFPRFGLDAGQPCEVISVYADGRACEVRLMTPEGPQEETLYFLCDQVEPLAERPLLRQLAR